MIVYTRFHVVKCFCSIYIGYKIDSAIKEVQKNKDPIEFFGKQHTNKNIHITVDYLSKVQEFYMLQVLNFLENSVDLSLVNNVIKIPEEIYVHYDYVSSHEADDVSLPENKHVRFGERSKNLRLENAIYDFLLSLKDNNILQVKETLYLIFIERFFTDFNRIFDAEFDSIKKFDADKLWEIKDFIDIEKNLLNLSTYISEEINSLYFSDKHIKNEVIKIEIFNTIFKQYMKLLEYFISVDFEDIAGETNSIFVFKAKRGEKKTVTYIRMPILKISKENNEIARKFFNNYMGLRRNNKPLTFEWHGLSAGETQLLNLFTGLSQAIKDIEKDQILILLDEVEISLHPMLQKQFMRMLMEILNKTAEKYDTKIQVILTTHSPFVLSELPLHSLILLEKDHEQKVQVKNELENLTTTLGANIHELFSHSFFLTGGLIGEYAKERINEVANNLLGIESNLNKEDIRKFINQVGEPIIKSRLVELFEQKYALTKGEEMEKLQKQMAELQERMKRLEDGDGK
ncbi:MAG: AAA family ATPase [Caryophanon sp.]|nr:AAA family ATPase [Caryophanon sp.]